MSFHQSFETCNILNQKTTSNLHRITLKGKLRFGNGSPLDGAMVTFSGASQKCIFLGGGGNFLKILTVSDKTIHKSFRIHNAL